MEIKPIRTEEEYQNALKLIDDLIDCEENSKEEELLEVTSLLVWDYEEKYYPIGKLSPIEAIKTRIEELDLKQKDLATIIGDKSRVSDILTKKRRLTLKMIRKINKRLNIPLETLIQEY
ncbi:MAG: helix-turn-helix domain-containing protein [Bacteroidales bacterium]|nr:helix-turn-helix domain-containing protein [Bacteroidales bacterium]